VSGVTHHLGLSRLGAKRNRDTLPSSTQFQAFSRLETSLKFVVVGANLHRPSWADDFGNLRLVGRNTVLYPYSP
jgi:hypothetical protein